MSTITRQVAVDDPLYGCIEFSAEFARLFDTPEMQRLQEVQISIPSCFLQTPTPCASRFEHSRGVAYLAQVLARANPEFTATSLELQYAALVHDVGTPPFSHCSETIMQQQLAMDHEAFGRAILSGSTVECLAVSLGIDIEVASEYGRSKLFNGYPDLDNADNTPRYGTSQGLCQLNYDPVKLARGFCRVNGQYCLHQEGEGEVTKWAQCRRDIYDGYVYSPAHQAPYLMLRRAVELLAIDNELPRSFFTMTDAEALTFLLERGSTSTRQLIVGATRHEDYVLVFQEEVLVMLANELKIGELANAIARDLDDLPPHCVCASLQRGRGDKHRSLPFVDRAGYVHPLPRNGKPQFWKIVVYVAPHYQNRGQEIREYVDDQLNKTLCTLCLLEQP